jgi:DNA-binding transcriptional regulator YiaG
MTTPISFPEVPEVKFEDALKRFANQSRMAEAFGVERATVSIWKEKGVLPPLRALQFVTLVGIDKKSTPANGVGKLTD